jgi:ethanolamine ammonia-lyase large subunit
VLSHITTTIELVNRGAPVDLVFQSVAGTQGTNSGFGVDLALLREGQQAGESLGRGTVGGNLMYFETGQGSSLSSGTHHGVDQQTLEARAYGVARLFAPLLVNNVVGFIGPEYIDGTGQIIRAGLEDHFCGKLLGLPMGTDACYTNHAAIEQNDIESLATLLGAAGVNFLIAVAGGDDVMLGYQSLSFHDILYLRQTFGLRPSPEFEAWLQQVGLAEKTGPFRLAPPQGTGLFRLEGRV